MVNSNNTVAPAPIVNNVVVQKTVPDNDCVVVNECKVKETRLVLTPVPVPPQNLNRALDNDAKLVHNYNGVSLEKVVFDDDELYDDEVEKKSLIGFLNGKFPGLLMIGLGNVLSIFIILDGGSVSGEEMSSGGHFETGNFSWGSEADTRKTRLLDVVYNAYKNEIVRTQTLVKGTIIQVDAAPFKQWYSQHYGVDIGRKKKKTATAAKKECKVSARVKQVLTVVSEEGRGNEGPPFALHSLI